MFSDPMRTTERVIELANHADPERLTASPIKFAFKRCTPQSLYIECEHWFSQLKIEKVISHQQSESNGYITITLFYR